MQFLFNKVYLSLDVAFESNTPCMLITPLVADLPSSDFERQVVSSDLGSILASGSSYEEAVENAGGEVAFFERLSDADPTKRVLIYANPAAYITILTKWYKALLPNLTGRTAYDLVKLSLVRVKHTYGYPYVPQRRLNRDQASSYYNLPAALADVDSFVASWEEIEPFDLSGKGYDYYAARCGVEFLLATLFADPVTPWLPEIERCVLKLVDMNIVNIVSDPFEDIVRQPSLIPGYNPHTQTVDQWVAEHPKHAPIVDARIALGDVDHVLDTYDMAELVSVYKDVLGWIGYELKPNNWLDRLLTTDASRLDTVISIELDSTYMSVAIAAGRRVNLINTYVLRRLYQGKRDGDTVFASALSLRSK